MTPHGTACPLMQQLVSWQCKQCIQFIQAALSPVAPSAGDLVCLPWHLQIIIDLRLADLRCLVGLEQDAWTCWTAGPAAWTSRSDQAPRGPAGPAAWTGCLDLDRLRTPWGDSVSNVTIGVIDAIGIIDA